MPSYEEVIEARDAERAQHPLGPTPQQLAAMLRESALGRARRQVGDERAKADLRLQYLRGAIEKLQKAMDLPKTLIGQDAKLQRLAGGGGAHDAEYRHDSTPAGAVRPAAPAEPIVIAENVRVAKGGVKKITPPRRKRAR